MIRRIAVAVVGIPAAVASIYVGGWVLVALIGVLGVVGVVELFRMARHAGVHPFVGVGVGAGIAVPIATYAIVGLDVPWAAKVLLYSTVGAIVLTTTLAMVRGPTKRPMATVGITLLGVVYPVGLLAFVIVLRHAPDSTSRWGVTWIVLFPLVLTWVGDSVAMAGGGWFGGPKLAPTLSPKKTWAGAIVGTTSAVALAPLYGTGLTRFGIHLSVWQLALFGLLVSVIGQVGDIGESLFKREAGIKDSGRFFSGHGGVLDRLDALYWALPAAAIFYDAVGLW